MSAREATQATRRTHLFGAWVAAFGFCGVLDPTEFGRLVAGVALFILFARHCVVAALGEGA